MIKHLQSRFLVVPGAVIACLLVFAGSAHGQLKLRPEVFQAPDATAFKKDIDAFVNQHVAALKEGKAGISSAREALAQQAVQNGASPSFLQVYSTTLATAISAQGLATADDVHVRLNTAIVIAKVAAAANNTAFAELATTLVQDKSEAVAIWGVKAAQPTIPALLLAGSDAGPLARAIIEAIKSNPASDYLPEDGNNALTFFGGINQGKVTAAMLKPYVQYPIDLFEHRVGLFQSGIPAAPLSDASATAFLSFGGWPAMSAKQQSQTANLMVALLNNFANQITDPKPELWPIMKKTAQALGAIGTAIGDTKLVADAAALAGMSANSVKDDLVKKIKPIEDDVKAHFNATSIARP